MNGSSHRPRPRKGVGLESSAIELGLKGKGISVELYARKA